MATIDKWGKVKGMKVEKFVRVRTEDGKNFAVLGYEKNASGDMVMVGIHFGDKIEDGRVPLYELWTDEVARFVYHKTERTVAAREG